MIRQYGFLLMLMLAAVVLPAHAQSGCDDSPESPTIVLALVGGMGAAVTAMRTGRSRKK